MCECQIDADDGCCSVEAHSARIVKARKNHKCGECDQVIKGGEQYEYVWAIWDGEPGFAKTCLDCKSVRDVFFTSWLYGCMWEDVHNLIEELNGDISTCNIIDLTSAARKNVCDRFEEYRKEWVDDE